ETFFHQLAELRVAVFQIADGVRFEREQAAIAGRFNGGSARRAVQDREFAEEVAVAIESEILLRAVFGMKGTRAPFLKNEHRAGRIALPGDRRAFRQFDWSQLLNQTAERGHGQPSEIAELVKETMERPMSPGDLDLVL